MCKAWDEYTRDCEKRGEKRGIKRGKEKFCIGVVIAMLSERLPISSIIRVTGKSLAAIRKIAKENNLDFCL